MLDIQGTDYSVFRRAYGQFHHLHPNRQVRKRFAMFHLSRAVFAQMGRIFGITAKATTLYRPHGRQQISNGPHRRGFGRAFFPLDQYAAQGRVDNIQNQGLFHFFLPHDRGKRIYACSHVQSPFRYITEFLP